MRTLGTVAAISLFSAVTFGTAAAADLDLKQLKAIVTDLGYQPTSDANSVSIADQGSAKMPIYFYLNGRLVTILASFYEIASEKKAKMPMLEMLKANNNGNIAPFYYAIGAEGSKEWVVLEAQYDVALVNKQMLRHTIDAMIETMNAGEALWNPEKWASADTAAPMAQDAAQTTSKPAPTSDPPKEAVAAAPDFIATCEAFAAVMSNGKSDPANEKVCTCFKDKTSEAERPKTAEALKELVNTAKHNPTAFVMAFGNPPPAMFAYMSASAACPK